MDYFCILTLLAALSFSTCGDALKCWTCSSDLDDQCGDTFNHTSPNFGLHHTLTDCNSQTSPHYPFLNSKSVCKKVKQTVNGELTIIRSCAWLQKNEETGTCPPTTTPSYIKMEFCETCDHDSCNGADSLSSTALWKTLVPLALAIYLRK